MADVIIHRCTLRVVRRGGWSWGADPRRLLEGVVSAFPGLLARKLAELLPDDADADISAPLRLTVPLRMNEVLALAAASPDGSAHAVSSPLAALGDLIEKSLREHQVINELARAEPAPDDEPPRRAVARPETPEPDGAPRGPLLRLLAAWRARGELELRLAAFTTAALTAWHDALLDADESRPRAGVTVTAEAVRALVRELARGTTRAPSARDEIVRRRIVIAVEVIESLGASPRRDDLGAALDDALPLAGMETPGDVTRARGARDATREAAAAARAARPSRAPSAEGVGASPPPAAVLRAPRGIEVHVSSALPFLLLGPLAQIGYLQTLAAALEAANLADDAPLFAAALAHKVLPPPERGWRRKAASSLAAAAFAGLVEPPAEHSLTIFSERVAPHLSPLDASVAHALARGHNPLKPLVLCRAPGAGHGLMLADAEGIFPIALADDLAGLLPTLRQFGQTTLLVPSETAAAGLLRSLEEEGFLFVTDATPARGEGWRTLRRPPAGRWYTNDTSGADKSLLRAARLLAGAGEEASLLWQAVGVERAGVPLATDASLERSLTLAASVALGTISWSLWRARETVTPLLALERFGDLDARVRFGERVVSVSLPLGRRRVDLYEHGLLEDVADVPWLGGRRVEFSGG